MALDTATLYYRAFHALPTSLAAPDGVPVNAVRGTLDMVAALVNEFEPDVVVGGVGRAMATELAHRARSAIQGPPRVGWNGER
jgi:5'-3' exonuclease